MAAGYGLLRLAPDQFWAMTPRELDAALAAITGHLSNSQIGRGELAALMQQFPDKQGS